MDRGPLKKILKQCRKGPFFKQIFPLATVVRHCNFQMHTKESYMADAKMGAGIMECDVTFTKDRELECRHSQCDLHTTTNILEVPELAAKCSIPRDSINVINNDGDMLEVLDVLAKDVGIIGIFFDWPATVTYYANCMD